MTTKHDPKHDPDPDHELLTCVQNLVRDRVSLKALVADLTVNLAKALHESRAIKIENERLEALVLQHALFVGHLIRIIDLDLETLERAAASGGDSVGDAILDAVRSILATIPPSGEAH